jgi:hypothetical protein
MKPPEKPPKCRAVGVCRLPHGHTGLCLYMAHSVAPPTIAQVGTRDGQVFVDFGAPGPWQVITLSPKQALEFGVAMVRRAYRLLIELADDVH